ncbi:SDR family NAD(P)-dependent oxidoreductase [Streptomyces sp. AcE210]|uniref:SDR family NAD(P)-dependent oxidoreductase n=1 Tax=Streptomyces sp. AcE210 TaxID=2292703 RepID=UPI000E308E08|nr:SDR family NAD(P)-dependent oxidoreductase [Streptomyces sp. AcE210]RFC77465.1 SDR family NAD(P)-dependent oxidoreductase [Streptomyces sp. AcE210]
MSKVFFITGAGRGLGADIARQALAAGHQVVATGRRPEQVVEALGGEQDSLQAIALDITDPAAAQRAVDAAVDRFGRIDVLINNAANFYAGFFEELSDAQVRAQIETNLFGPMNVTRAVLPVMRRQRSGHIITLSSLAGVVGVDFCVAYSAAKFGVEGFMESLQHDVAPFGIHTTIVEPGFFRTELLVDASTTYAEGSIDDYAERTAATKKVWESMNGRQTGDPVKLADALLKVAGLEQPPLRFIAGDDCLQAVEAKATELLAQVDASRPLGSGLAHTDAA